VSGEVNNFDLAKINLSKVAIIILNWNGWRDTIECLESVFRIDYPNYQVIVLDNGSTDGSVEKIKAWAEGKIPVESKFFEYNSNNKPIHWVEYDRTTAEAGGIYEKELYLDKTKSNRKMVIIQIGANLGFAGGNNVGIRYGLKHKFKYIWLLNNDTVVDSLCLKLCVDTFNFNELIGVVGPKILWYDDPSRIWYAGAKVKLWRGAVPYIGMLELDNEHFKGVRYTEHVSGCALIAKREVFEEIGLLDEDYFLVHEDSDWSLRVQKHSQFSLAVNLDACIYHKAGGISASGRDKPISVYFSNKHRFILVTKYGSPLEKILFFIFYFGSRPFKFGYFLLKGRRDLIKAELSAVFDFLLGKYGIIDMEKINSWKR